MTPVVLVSVILAAACLGEAFGNWRTRRRVLGRLEKQRAARRARWEPKPLVPTPNDGSPASLTSAYEDAIYASVRHNFALQYGDGDEHLGCVQGAELHAEVRRLRAEITARLGETPRLARDEHGVYDRASASGMTTSPTDSIAGPRHARRSDPEVQTAPAFD